MQSIKEETAQKWRRALSESGRQCVMPASNGLTHSLTHSLSFLCGLTLGWRIPTTNVPRRATPVPVAQHEPPLD